MSVMTQGASAALAQQVRAEAQRYDEETIPDPDGDGEEYTARTTPRQGDKAFQVSAWVRDNHNPDLDRWGDPQKPETIQLLQNLIQERLGRPVKLDVEFLQKQGKLIDLWAEKAKRRYRISSLPGMTIYARPGDGFEAIEDYAAMMIERKAEVEPGVPFTKDSWSNKFDVKQNLSHVVIRAGG
jgi:hypothetical protein